MSALDDALALVKANGYVVLKEKSYRAAQRRQGVAESRRAWAERDAEHSRQWAESCLYDERRLSERLTFVWGVARAHGATSEELAADPITRAPRRQ